MTKYLKFIVPLVLITLAFGYALIQLIGGGNPVDPAQPAVLDGFAAMKTIGVLAFVFLLLAIFAWLAKSWFSPLQHLNGKERNLQVLDSLPVSPKSKIMLVKVVNETLLLGITEQSISVLSDIEMPAKDEEALESRRRPHRFLSALRDQANSQPPVQNASVSGATRPER